MFKTVLKRKYPNVRTVTLYFDRMKSSSIWKLRYYKKGHWNLRV